MAQRIETAQRKEKLLRELRSAHQRGEGDGRETALSQRELSARFGLSAFTVSQVLQQLVQEGVLYTVPRVGTFLGRPRSQAAELYLMLSRVAARDNAHIGQMQTGFQDRLALLGGVSDALSRAEYEASGYRQQAGQVAGHFGIALPEPLVQELASSGPLASYSVPGREGAWDSLDFDHVEGGEQAARHLLSVGHRNIAFLGMHGSEVAQSLFPWSALRQQGWQAMMEKAGQSTAELVFLAPGVKDVEAQSQANGALQAALQLLEHADISAVIAVNVFALHGLLQALESRRVPAARWPAIVCFDETPRSRASGVSYLRLPWEKLGEEAAQLLWDRNHGVLSGPPQRRLVRMHLIPRLTCRADWALENQFLHQRVADLATRSLELTAPI